MLSVVYNSYRGCLSHTLKRSVNVVKYATQAVAAEIPITEKQLPKRPTTIIKCKNESLNFYEGQSYSKFEPVPLASKGWRHRKAINDYFIIHPDANPEAASDSVELTSFRQSSLNRQLIQNLEENDLTKPSEIQSVAIPVVLSGKNNIIAAETGCGKTLAYLLPILEQIYKWKKFSKRNFNEPLGLIISPSRELAQQIGIVAKKISKNMDIEIEVIIGGKTKKHMLNPNFQDVDLLIGTIGVLSKLTTTGIYNMSLVRHVVLEEADTLLDDSFSDKLRHFLSKIKFRFAGPESLEELPKSSQLTLVSATMPHSIPETLDQIINTDSLVRLTTENLHRMMPQVAQKFIRLTEGTKATAILKIAKESVSKRYQTIVFCNKVKTCEWLYLFLTEFGVACTVTYGGMSAEVRADKFAEFQRGTFKILITTDACARGLDTIKVNHVVNFDFPLYTADYIHRCGRTGRLGNNEKCSVTNFITTEREIQLLQAMERSVRNSKTLPAVDGNITRVISHKIRGEIERSKLELGNRDVPQYLNI